MDVSAIVAVHPRDDNDAFEAAVESLLTQTRMPNEIIIAHHEYLQTLQEWQIDEWLDEYPDIIKPVSIPHDKGAGGARAMGVEAASNELIAILDSDDVAVEDRLRKQADYLEATDPIDVLGGYLAEYDGDLETKTGVREVPTDVSGPMLRRLAKIRCPMNHPTVMMRRSAVLDAGNYRDLNYGEDWDLWLRMLQKGYQLSNHPIVFSKARTGDEWHERRGGSIALDEIKLQKQFVEDGTVNPMVAALNLGVRLPVRLAPDGIRKSIYDRVLRGDPANA
jgi:glycosyltransferase involved in cell wall biosynthesis